MFGLYVTRRLSVLFLLGVPLIFLANFWGASLLIFFAYNIFLLLLYILDLLLTPKPSALEITRDGSEKLSVHGENVISFIVRNNSSRIVHAELKDDLPDWHFQTDHAVVTQKILPKKTETISYTVIPTKRGSFHFGTVHLRYRGVLGLCAKMKKAKLVQEYKVYPNMQDLSKYRLMIQRNRLLHQGDRVIKSYGAGMEFESLREYMEGDDYKKVNWMATARENKLIVNQYEMEKNQPLMIMLDTGKSLSYGTGGYKKLDYAINASLILSDIVNQQGDQSGLLVFDTDVKTLIMPKKGAGHRNQLMEALYHVTDLKITSDYENAFLTYEKRQKRRSIVCLFTDFATQDEAEDIIRHLPILTKRHIVMVMLMENASVLKMIEAASNTMKDVYEKGAALDFLKQRDKIKQTLKLRGINCVESPPEGLALSAVNRYLWIKSKNIL